MRFGDNRIESPWSGLQGRGISRSEAYLTSQMSASAWETNTAVSREGFNVPNVHLSDGIEGFEDSEDPRPALSSGNVKRPAMRAPLAVENKKVRLSL